MNFFTKCSALISLLILSLSLSVSAQDLTLYAAGSLKSALGDVAAAYEKEYNTAIVTKFGPSGLLRKAHGNCLEGQIKLNRDVLISFPKRHYSLPGDPPAPSRRKAVIIMVGSWEIKKQMYF